jgi:hypothetical protein
MVLTLKAKMSLQTCVEKAYLSKTRKSWKKRGSMFRQLEAASQVADHDRQM